MISSAPIKFLSLIIVETTAVIANSLAGLISNALRKLSFANSGEFILE